MQPQCFLGDFTAVEPAYRSSQASTLAWTVQAHTRAERTRAEAQGQSFDPGEFERAMTMRVEHFACGPDKIRERGYELGDCAHTDWDKMSVYRLHEKAAGEGALARSRLYGRFADAAFARVYAARDSPPADLVHVTCTGYESPSAAQRLVAERGWGMHTRVTHAYHMGCYAAFPALRIAAHGVQTRKGRASRSDVVHAECSSLHLNPLVHTAEQFVIESLFADGAIGYGVRSGPAPRASGPELELLATREELLPDSSHAMSWVSGDAGMQMTLARNVPEYIARALGGFVDRLCDEAELPAAERRKAVFAVHPGGPRILDFVRDKLELSEEQLGASRAVLLARGNMSSATVPYIWRALVDSADVPGGQPVVSLAFGPGLTLCGAVLRKVA